MWQPWLVPRSATRSERVVAPAGAGAEARVNATAGNSLSSESTTSEEVRWLELVAQGDQQAYRQLMNRHLRGVHAFAYRMLGSRAEAEEVSQECFLRLWKHAGRYVAHAKPSTWLYRITHNLAIDRLRRRREGSHPEGLEEVAASERQSALVHDRQVARVVERALQDLPQRQRAAIQLVHYQGLSNAEAAEVLGIGVRALESLLARARRQLREQLAELATSDRREP
jgi:RNA polymerase sigma-70 factor (ECF subfamily)